MNGNRFVFVVCGAKEHIDILNYSLRALKNFSATEIIVLTDTARNDEIILHDHLVDIRTPAHFNDHQASIFLKTGIFKYVPKGFRYCYLDTDVVALNRKVDEIFNLFTKPITFARDHCGLDRFSPAAINCSCIKQFEIWRTELKQLIEDQKQYERVPEQQEKKLRLEQQFEYLRKNIDPFYSLRYWLSPNKFRLNNEFVLDKKKRVWLDNEGNPVMYELPNTHPRIEDISEYRCYADKEKGYTWTIHGKEVFAEHTTCDHLVKCIEKEFGIQITDQQWRQWNGGVFLFEDQSSPFLEAWHEKTLHIFKNDEWKTRDQGTLAATVWEYGLKDHPTLPITFNFIADFEHQEHIHKGNLVFSVKNHPDLITPNFIHVYHHWGDGQWDIWREVEKKTEIALEPERDFFNALWVGNTLSKLELLTIHSFLEHNHRFRLWAYDEIATPLPKDVILADANEIIAREQIFNYKFSNTFGHGKGSYAGFSDIFRYKLLYERGGWWTDMDVTCLKRIYSDKAYFFRPHHDMPVVGNVMKCPKGSKLMKLCYEKAVQNVDENNTDWHKPVQILNDFISELELQKYISENVSNEDRWEVTSKFIWNNEGLPQDWMFIHWQNEEWRAKGIDKTDCYHRSTLAELLNKYGLFKMPLTRKEKILNEVRYHAVTRTFLKVISWYENPAI